MSLPTMRFGAMKTTEHEASLMLIGMGERLVSTRTRLANTLRSHAAEYGLTADIGFTHRKR
jgi:transposase